MSKHITLTAADSQSAGFTWEHGTQLCLIAVVGTFDSGTVYLQWRLDDDDTWRNYVNAVDDSVADFTADSLMQVVLGQNMQYRFAIVGGTTPSVTCQIF